MNKPRLGEFAQIAEIIAAVAVVISLIYVGRGLNENTAAIRAASVQAVTTGTREALLTVAADEDLSRIVLIGQQDRSALSELEAHRFLLWNRQRWTFFEGVWVQWTIGVLDDKIWRSYERVICSILDDPGDREEWSNHEDVFNPEFVSFVEECSK